MPRNPLALRALALGCALALFAACGPAASGARAEYDAPRTVVATNAGPGTAVAGVTEQRDREAIDFAFSDDDESPVTETKVLDTAQAEPAPDGAEPTEPAPAQPEAGPRPPSERIVIYSADLGVYVLELDLAIERTLALSEQLGGWLQASTSTWVTLRIPADRFEEFLAGIDGIGRVVERNVVGQDVTEEFYDLEIRLHNALVLRERFETLLARATTVEETLAIETELARITTEIERLKGRLRFLREHAAHSTVTVRFYEDATQLAAGQRVALPFYWLSTYSLPNLYERY